MEHMSKLGEYLFQKSIGLLAVGDTTLIAGTQENGHVIAVSTAAVDRLCMSAFWNEEFEFDSESSGVLARFGTGNGAINGLSQWVKCIVLSEVRRVEDIESASIAAPTSHSQKAADYALHVLIRGHDHDSPSWSHHHFEMETESPEQIKISLLKTPEGVEASMLLAKWANSIQNLPPGHDRSHFELEKKRWELSIFEAGASHRAGERVSAAAFQHSLEQARVYPVCDGTSVFNSHNARRTVSGNFDTDCTTSLLDDDVDTCGWTASVGDWVILPVEPAGSRPGANSRAPADVSIAGLQIDFWSDSPVPKTAEITISLSHDNQVSWRSLPAGHIVGDVLPQPPVPLVPFALMDYCENGREKGCDEDFALKFSSGELDWISTGVNAGETTTHVRVTISKCEDGNIGDKCNFQVALLLRSNEICSNGVVVMVADYKQNGVADLSWRASQSNYYAASLQV